MAQVGFEPTTFGLLVDVDVDVALRMVLIYFQKQLPVSFVIYADFEAITKKVQGCEQSEEMKSEKNKRSYTEAYQTHEDCGYGYKVVCCYNDKYLHL